MVKNVGIYDMQFSLMEPPGGMPYIVYREDVSKADLSSENLPQKRLYTMLIIVRTLLFDKSVQIV